MGEGKEAGKILAGLAGEDWLRWAAVDVTAPLAEAKQMRDLTPVAVTALGRALGGVALLYRHALRTPSNLQLNVRGDGPLGEVSAEISARRFRGRVATPHLANVHFGERSQRLGDAIGSGRLEVIREEKRGEFRSHAALVTGEIGSDLAHYLLQSEQTRSVIAVGELLTPDGVAAAGGYLIEALPGTPEAVLKVLESNLASAPAWSESLSLYGIEAAVRQVLDGLDAETREQDPLDYRCGCDRESVIARLRALPQADRQDLAAASGLTAECEYCGTAYPFTAGDLADSEPTASGDRMAPDAQ